MQNRIKFIVLDSDENRISKFSGYIAKIFPDNKILYAQNGSEGIELIKKNQPCIILCEENLPQHNAQTVIRKIKRDDISLFYFIVITDDNKLDHVNELINQGCDDYLTNESNISVIYNRFRISIRFLHLKTKLLEENWLFQKLTKELEEESQNLIEISARFLQARMPASYEMLKRITTISSWIADQFEELDSVAKRNIYLASYLCQSGRIFLPDELLKLPVMSNGQPRHPLMHQVPVASKEIVSSIEKFKPVADIIYHIYENLDGSGMPAKLQAWKIPLGSRIIRVVLDYEENRYLNNLKREDALNKLKDRTGRLYDQRIVQLLEQYLRENAEDFEENEMSLLIAELRPGMKLTKDIVSGSGMKLLSTGSELTEKTIATLLNHSVTDPIFGYIFVEKNYYNK